MRKIKLMIWLAGLFAFSGCAGETGNRENLKGDGGEQITVKFDEKEVFLLLPTYATFASFKKGLILNDEAIHNKDERIEAIVHRIYLANYDLQLTDPSKQDYRRISGDGQFRVEIQLEAERGAAENAPVKVQEYRTKTEPFDRVSSITVSRFANGKDSNTILGGSRASGIVRITSVTESEIKGEVDLSDSDGSVKGKFAARKLK